MYSTIKLQSLRPLACTMDEQLCKTLSCAIFKNFQQQKSRHKNVRNMVI